MARHTIRDRETRARTSQNLDNFEELVAASQLGHVNVLGNRNIVVHVQVSIHTDISKRQHPVAAASLQCV